MKTRLSILRTLLPIVVLTLLFSGIVTITNAASEKRVTKFTEGGVVFISDENGSITVRVTGGGRNIDDAVSAAEEEVFEVLLFRGVVGSKYYSDPLVGTNEKDEKSESRKYFKTLMERRERYLSFIVSSIPVSKYKKNKTTLDVKVNVAALKKDLEVQGVIPPFGFK